MHFDRTRTEPEGSRNLLVGTAMRHLSEDLKLPWRQTGVFATFVGRCERLRRQGTQPQRRLLHEGRGTERVEQVDGAALAVVRRRK
ncbi:hypothetical protein [Piscinibacter sp.]|uniref:hypothetical protein n=1 Tax=Piscinibacter sp. TaxID=1903157 RepID=UPI002B840187|nr:hypothetical protein [Albitalea sp.]HUG25458.1 hypothetical protein [Albitalea sp.]